MSVVVMCQMVVHVHAVRGRAVHASPDRDLMPPLLAWIAHCSHHACLIIRLCACPAYACPQPLLPSLLQFLPGRCGRCLRLPRILLLHGARAPRIQSTSVRSSEHFINAPVFGSYRRCGRPATDTTLVSDRALDEAPFAAADAPGTRRRIASAGDPALALAAYWPDTRRRFGSMREHAACALYTLRASRGAADSLGDKLLKHLVRSVYNGAAYLLDQESVVCLLRFLLVSYSRRP